MNIFGTPAMSSSRFFAILTFAALCAATVFTASAQSAEQQQQQGLVVARDPQTGQLRAPTPAEIKALSPQQPPTLQAPAQPSLVINPDGSRRVHMGERGLVYSVVSRDAEGKLSRQCVRGEDAATESVTQPQPAAKDNEEHSHESR